MVRLLAVVAAVSLLAGTGAATAEGPPPSRVTEVPKAVIVAAGDIACPPGAYVGPRACRQDATARIAARLDPDRVLALGDLQYPSGSFTDFRSSYGNSWGVLKPRTWPVVGNHEYRTPGARGFFRYFDRQTEPPGSYRRTINGWQVYVINTNCDRIDCRQQRNWLRNRMLTHPSRCALVAMHHPRFSSGREHGSDATMKPFWEIAQRYGADLVLSGHDHDYERFRVQDSTGHADPEGMQQLVVGTGGKSLYPKGRTAAGSRKFVAAFGVVRLTLRPRGWSWQFRDTAFELRDSGSLTCR